MKNRNIRRYVWNLILKFHWSIAKQRKIWIPVKANVKIQLLYRVTEGVYLNYINSNKFNETGDM